MSSKPPLSHWGSPAASHGGGDYFVSSPMGGVVIPESVWFILRPTSDALPEEKRYDRG